MTSTRSILRSSMAAVIVAVTTLAGAGQSPADLRQYLEAGKYKDAELAGRALLTATEQQYGAGTPEAADILDLLVESLWRQGVATPELKRLAERAAALRERLSPGTFEHARALFNLANVYDNDGQYAVYKATLTRAVEIGTAARGAGDPDLAMFVSVLGMAHRAVGEYEDARTHLQRALAVRRRHNPEDVNVAKIQHNLGAVLWELGDLEGARAAFQESTRLFEKTLGPAHPIVPNAYEGLGVLLLTSGDYAGAKEIYERTLRLREQVLPAGHPEIGTSYSNLGDLLLVLGDYQGARRSLDRALAIWQKAHGLDHPLLTTALTNLGATLVRLGDPLGARRAFERVVALREKAGDEAKLVIPLRELANVLAATGNAERAWPLYRRALELGERTRGADHPYVAATALDEARQLARRGRLDEAEPLIRQALAAYERVLGRDHPDYAAALDAEARLLSARGDHAGAMRKALEAEAIARRHFQSTAIALPERQALLYAEARTRSQDLALASAIAAGAADREQLELLWDTVVRSRALVLDEMARRTRKLTSDDDANASRLRNELASARRHLAALMLRGPRQDTTEAYRRELEAARSTKERLEVELASRQPRREHGEDAGLDAVRRALPEGTALVSYMRLSSEVLGNRRASQYAVFVTGPADGDAYFVTLGDAAEIDALVATWRLRIREETTAPDVGTRRREQLYRRDGAALRKRVWDPVARHLTGATRAMIVPDGSLHLVDFASLPLGTRGYLAEEPAVLHYLAAERDLVTRGDHHRGTGLLAVGGVDFHGTLPAAPKVSLRTQSGCATAAVPVHPLPASRREVEEITRMWRRQGSDAVALVGARASEARVRQMAPGRRVLHLATHGFFPGERCATSVPVVENALLTSGLVLAGAARGRAVRSGRAIDDGILTAEEIAGLDLTGVEWAVLSACDSGTGTVLAGEGVLGLRRAFHVAGAATILMSLWPVEDEMAGRWMQRVYESRFIRQRSTAEAVREASLSLLAARRRDGLSTHPFYWTGFVAAGDWR